MNESLKRFGMLTLGTLLVAAGVYFFKFPNNFSTGGVSGISLILGRLLPQISPGGLVLIINTALLALGFLIFGRDFGLNTAYCSLVMSGAICLLEWIYPMARPFTDQPMLELVFAIMLPAFGSALLFNMGASTGGTDIVAMVLKKYTNVDIGRALLLSDFLIVVGSALAFGIQTGLFSFLGLAAKALLVDSIIENINLSKYFTIVTQRPGPVCDFILYTLNRSATTCPVTGAFTHEPKTLILTAMSRSQAVKLRAFLKQHDPDAFLLITNTSEIIGKGFRGVS